MNGIRVKVQLREKSALDDTARKVLLRAISTAQPVGVKALDLQPGRVGIAVYLTRSDYSNLSARAERMTAMTGDLTTVAEYASKRIVADFLHDNGLDAAQAVAAKSLYGNRALLPDSRQSIGGRLWLTCYVSPAEYAQLEMAARKANKESVSDLLTDQVIPFWCKDNPLSDMGAQGLKSLYGPTPVAKETEPLAGYKNPHGPRPVIVPGRL